MTDEGPAARAWGSITPRPAGAVPEWSRHFMSEAYTADQVRETLVAATGAAAELLVWLSNVRQTCAGRLAPSPSAAVLAGREREVRRAREVVGRCAPAVEAASVLLTNTHPDPPPVGGCREASVHASVVRAAHTAVFELVRWVRGGGGVSPTVRLEGLDFDRVARHLRVERNLALQKLLELRPPADAPVPDPALRLAVVGTAVLLDGHPVPLGLTAEASGDALTYLRAVIEAAPNWVSGPDIARGIRWDRVRKRLPARLRSLIETNRRKGYRLRNRAWRT
jgi:hypothetical protein